MAKPYKIPDFRKIYPNASEEVIAVLRKTERQMQYQEYDKEIMEKVRKQRLKKLSFLKSSALWEKMCTGDN